MPRKPRSRAQEAEEKAKRLEQPRFPASMRILDACEAAGCEAWSEVAVLSRARNRYVALCEDHYRRLRAADAVYPKRLPGHRLPRCGPDATSGPSEG